MSTAITGEPWGQPREHVRELLDFAAAARLRDGFGRLGDHGQLISDEAEVMITARMGISFAVGSILFDRDRDADQANHAIGFLGRELDSVTDGYDLCFTVTAAATAAEAGIASAAELCQAAIRRWETYFWTSPDHVRYDASDDEGYVGANVNMHAVEALLALDHFFPGQDWAERALRIADTFINHAARDAGWMLPEHFTADLTPLPDFNNDRPLDEFRPYGVTPGHQLEWSRLLIELRQALGAQAPDWLAEAAAGLFAAAQRGYRDGWGFVYTMTPDGRPVADIRLHWVHLEAVAAAAVLGAAGESDAADLLGAYRQLAGTLFHDRELGSWHHELAANGLPAGTLFRGKPDIYHGIQGVLVQAVPAGQSLAQRAAILASEHGGMDCQNGAAR